jgi:hypothetical protein
MDGGVPYLAYVDSDAMGDKATVMRHSGGVWSAVGAERFSSQLNSGLDFGVTAGTPYVQYRTWDGYGLVMKHDGNNWVTVGGAEFDLQPRSTALTLDYAGWPVVAYVSSGQMLWVRRNAGVAYWNEFLGGALTGENAFGLSASTLGRVHYVAYTDVGEANKVTVKKYDTLQPLLGWVAVGSPGITPGQAYTPSVCADSGGVYVAYQDLTTSPNRRLSVMKYDGFGWSNLGPVGISEDAAYGISLFVHNGVPYVAYLDSADFYKVVVLKYE